MNASTPAAVTYAVALTVSTLTRTALENLTKGQPVLITLDNGRTIKGYVTSTASYANTGCQVIVSDENGKAFNLFHYMSDSKLSNRVGCLAFNAAAKPLPKSVFTCGVAVIESYT